MSVQYLVDGYNAIYRISDFLKNSLEESRKSLISFIERTRPQGSSKNLVTVVFDGKPGMISGMRSNSVKIIFTERTNADEKIKRIVDQAKIKKNIVVVTDDKEIQFYVCQLGAKKMSIEQFFIKKEANGPVDSRRVSHVQEHEINQELKDVWLKE